MSDDSSEHNDDTPQVFDLSLPDVIDKYRSAGNVANAAIIAILESIAEGVSVFDLCEMGDRVIRENLEFIFTKKRKMKKGIAFPTCISVNNCIGHFSPATPEESIVLAEGDVVKIDLGVHIDGFISTCAHTTVVNSSGEQIGGRAADVICAAYFASQVAHKLVRPGRSNIDVTNAIQKMISCYDCKAVQGVLSHQLQRNTIDGKNCIINRPEVDQIVDEFKFEINEVYAIDIVVSTGEGKTRELEAKTNIYRKTPNPYSLKAQNARQLLNDVSANHQEMPFHVKNFESIARTRMGVKEMVDHSMLQPYPVLYERNNEVVAQFKFTLLVLPNSTQNINEGFPLPFVSSELTYEGDEDLVNIMAMSVQRKKRKRKR